MRFEARLQSHGRFWAAALGGYEIAPHDEAEPQRLRVLAIYDPDDDSTERILAADGRPNIFLRQVPEGS
jgi:hypothetical protein